MPDKAHRYIKEVHDWLKDNEVEVVEADSDLKELFKYDIGRIFIKTTILAYILDINIFNEMDDILKDKDIEFKKIVDELSELGLEEE